jgi:hypothetical protein
MFCDEEENLLRRKTFFSYGFVKNEVEIYRDESMVRFEIDMEPVPEFFKGTKMEKLSTKSLRRHCP